MVRSMGFIASGGRPISTFALVYATMTCWLLYASSSLSSLKKHLMYNLSAPAIQNHQTRIEIGLLQSRQFHGLSNVLTAVKYDRFEVVVLSWTVATLQILTPVSASIQQIIQFNISVDIHRSNNCASWVRFYFKIRPYQWVVAREQSFHHLRDTSLQHSRLDITWSAWRL